MKVAKLLNEKEKQFNEKQKQIFTKILHNCSRPLNY